ncbi:2,3-bisphosphoglycerate-independent phosphoglycerate mutase [Clostridium sp. UBA1056]|uniref:2,3-bisphosphoglycerate-independent phosphoglycerate mutase n=1 Tax=unclassified Clostridium TaxID=2614128 RepID=UPI003216C139
MNKKPVMLMILDGFGISDNVDGNAVREARKPNYDELKAKYPHTTLSASGLDVGLPEGQMGNSEVGHLNIGAGRIVYQELTRITKSIKDEDFFENRALNFSIDEALKNNSSVHLMGLLSDGGVHSHINHLKALITLCKKREVKKVFVHCFLDGRDVSPTSSKEFIEELQKHMNNEGVGEIATISGRYYAMDRDNRWERVQLAYNAMVKGEGNTNTSPFAIIEDAYHHNKTDEFIIPSVVVKDSKPVATIKNKDSVIFFNFRPDRAREITRALKDKEFKGFERENLDITYVCMTQYDKNIEDVQIAYRSESYKNTLGEYVSSKGLKQLRAAETEKYAHVTFFFNGGVEEPNKGEDRVLIPSPKVATYDLKPEMSAYEVTDAVLENIEKDEYDLIILNYANPDMVGHTGVIEAAVKAIEAVDNCLGKVVNKILEHNGTVFITADHGNAECMIDYSTGKPMTSHTTNLVPFIYVGEKVSELRSGGILADIAPTILTKMGLEIPSEMSGKSLI